MDLEGNNITVVCICGKFLQKQYIGIRNVSFKVWHCCLLLSSLGLFSFYYCYCWYMIVVRRPLLPFPTCSCSSLPLPPLHSECWTNHASCLDPVVAVSVLAPGVLFLRVFSLRGPGLCMCIRCYGGRLSMLTNLWVNSSSWPLGAFVICFVRLFEAWNWKCGWLTHLTSAWSHLFWKLPCDLSAGRKMVCKTSLL